MDPEKRKLKGSPWRDLFKRLHKELQSKFYAADADLCLVSKYPPGTVAYLDYKFFNDGVTFAEAIQYNEWKKHAPVFIVEGNALKGTFTIKRYKNGNWRPEPPEITYAESIEIKNWDEFSNWENNLRRSYRAKGGWQESDLRFD